MPASPKDTNLGLKAGWTPTKPVNPNTMIGVNLRLPAPLHRQLRIKSVMLDITLNEAIAQAVTEWTSK